MKKLLLAHWLIASPALAQDGIINPQTNASALTAGIVAATRGGAGTISGALKGNGAGVVSQAACADLSNASGTCSSTYVSGGAWTPADGSGAGLTFSSASAQYTQIGNMVFAYALISYPATGNGANAVISGLPVTFPNVGYARQCVITFATIATATYLLPNGGATTVGIFTNAGAAVPNVTMSGGTIGFLCTYPAS